ncbi:hypothetical protein CAJAP_06286 [Camponotus japonicus]
MKLTVVFLIMAILVCAMFQESEQTWWLWGHRRHGRHERRRFGGCRHTTTAATTASTTTTSASTAATTSASTAATTSASTANRPYHFSSYLGNAANPAYSKSEYLHIMFSKQESSGSFKNL